MLGFDKIKTQEEEEDVYKHTSLMQKTS